MTTCRLSDCIAGPRAFDLKAGFSPWPSTWCSNEPCSLQTGSVRHHDEQQRDSDAVMRHNWMYSACKVVDPASVRNTKEDPTDMADFVEMLD